MLWTISHWVSSPDLEFYLWSQEAIQLSSWENVDGSIIITTERDRWAKKLSFSLNSGITRFSFSESNDALKVGVSQENIDEFFNEYPFSKWILSERCDYWEGSKITMKLLGHLEGFSLNTAWYYLAQKQNLTQAEEQGIVEWLFEGITEQEKKVVADIFDY